MDPLVPAWDHRAMRPWFFRFVTGLLFFACGVGALLLAGWADDHHAGWFGMVCKVVGCAALLATIVLLSADALPRSWRRALFPRRPAARKRTLPRF